MNFHTSAKISLFCDHVLMAIVGAMCPGFYWVLQWYQSIHPLGLHRAGAVFLGFYLSAPAVLYALVCIHRLLKQILASRVFEEENVTLLRRVRRCCSYVSLICLLAGCVYPPLLFLFAILAFLALMVNVVKNVMSAAVELREENDLTI